MLPRAIDSAKGLEFRISSVQFPYWLLERKPPNDYNYILCNYNLQLPYEVEFIIEDNNPEHKISLDLLYHYLEAKSNAVLLIVSCSEDTYVNNGILWYGRLGLYSRSK